MNNSAWNPSNGILFAGKEELSRVGQNLEGSAECAGTTADFQRKIITACEVVRYVIGMKYEVL
jgi:hypothetical protein